MAFDKNHTTTGMKVVIVVFCVILVLSLCVPFISSCSVASDAGSQDDGQAQQSSSTAASTVAAVKQQYSGVISNLESKLADNAENTTAMASLGNNYMDMAAAMRSASDYSDNTDEVEQTYAKAAEYYDMYLERASSQAVSVDRAVCLFYGGKADEGVSALEEYVKGDGADYAMAWFNLGVMHYTGDTPDYAAAVEEFNKAAELDADGSAGVSLNAQIYAQLAQNMIDSQNSDDADDSSDGTDAAASGDAAADEAGADGADAQAEGEADATAGAGTAASDASSDKDADESSDAADGTDAAAEDDQSASK